jgi:site-specific DNA recombinase
VQGKLAAGSSARLLKLRASPSILAGRIFDDRGNRMTPTHTNKQGARYRYYVSHAVLQKRDDKTGSVVRVSAPEIETTVAEAVRNHLKKRKTNEREIPSTDRELIEQHVERIIVKLQAIEIHLVREAGHEPDEHDQQIADQCASKNDCAVVITVPWTTTAAEAAKGVLYSPLPRTTMSADDRDVLLSAIAKARAWIEDLVEGRVTSFAEIAKREGKVERHIRLLAPLAFVSPRIVADIVEGVLPPIAITELAKRMPYCWARQRMADPQSRARDLNGLGSRRLGPSIEETRIRRAFFWHESAIMCLGRMLLLNEYIFNRSINT